MSKVIIDCHGHYTTSPKAHEAWCQAQIAAVKEGAPPPPRPAITDGQILETIEDLRKTGEKYRIQTDTMFRA